MCGEKAWRQLRKNAASNIEQVLETAPHKAAAVRHLPPITKAIKIRGTRHAGHCWRSRDELISDVLLWTLSHGRAKAGRWNVAQRTCWKQWTMGTGGERGSGIFLLIVQHDDDTLKNRKVGKSFYLKSQKIVVYIILIFER